MTTAIAAQPQLTVTPAVGLTDPEADARRAAGQGNDARFETGRTYLQIVRENVFTFINSIIFLLGAALVVVGRPLDALVSVAVVSTNIVVSVAQEIRAKRILDGIALLTRPTARVIRDGKERTLAPELLVMGDLLAIGPGDQIVLDGRVTTGRIQLDESQLTGESDVVTRAVGDPVYSGSYCVGGSARFVVEHVGRASLANQITQGARMFRRVLTPLQLEVNKVIRVALLVVAYLEALLVFNSLVRVTPAGEAVGQATVLAGLIPQGLFVSIAVAYALGAVRLARFGALVQQSNAVESLSHVNVLCTDKTGTLTANRLSVVELLPIDADVDALRLALGTMVASAAARNNTAEAIATALPTVPVAVAADVPFSSARKWSAVAFDGPPTLRGAYVLGAPQFVQPCLAPRDDEAAGSWPNLEALIVDRTSRGLRVLLFAMHADPTAIRGQDDEATLEPGFAPLGLVVLQDELRPEAGATLARFVAAGVRLKIISGDDPDTVVALARQAGIPGELQAVSGVDIDAMTDAELGEEAARSTIFGRITPLQKERIVTVLRGRGDYVAMIGDGVNDVLSLKKADLAIAMASGSQATRGVADIILTNDSFLALAPAVEEGQRILNGMFAILSLFLARIATMGLIIVSALVVGVFPLNVRGGSVITLFSVGIPAVMLAVWAQPGRATGEGVERTIVKFVVPAAMLTSLVGLVVLYGTLGLEVAARHPSGQPGPELDAVVAAATPFAQSTLTTFLVMAGLVLIIFVEPPVAWFAVARAQTRDWRPTFMVFALAVAYVGLIVVEPLRILFNLQPLGIRDGVIVGVALVVWLLTLRLAWQHRLIERFVGN